MAMQQGMEHGARACSRERIQTHKGPARQDPCLSILPCRAWAIEWPPPPSSKGWSVTILPWWRQGPGKPGLLGAREGHAHSWASREQEFSRLSIKTDLGFARRCRLRRGEDEKQPPPHGAGLEPGGMRAPVFRGAEPLSLIPPPDHLPGPSHSGEHTWQTQRTPGRLAGGQGHGEEAPGTQDRLWENGISHCTPKNGGREHPSSKGPGG